MDAGHSVGRVTTRGRKAGSDRRSSFALQSVELVSQPGSQKLACCGVFSQALNMLNRVEFIQGNNTKCHDLVTFRQS